jgi:beta-1,4-N-acetylglucosaminyltransferase
MFSLKIIRQKIFTNKSIMIILGSGGHTGEILIMLSKLDFNKFTEVFFISAHNDKSSENKVKETIKLDDFKKTKFHFEKIYRSRNVGQSFKSSIFTTIYALFQSLVIIMKTRPSLVVSNGPGVAVPIIYIGFILKLLFILQEFKILFIESYCRTTSISLSGKLLQPICDKFIVLWENLKGGKKEYIGKIL